MRDNWRHEYVLWGGAYKTLQTKPKIKIARLFLLSRRLNTNVKFCMAAVHQLCHQMSWVLWHSIFLDTQPLRLSIWKVVKAYEPKPYLPSLVQMHQKNILWGKGRLEGDSRERDLNPFTLCKSTNAQWVQLDLQQQLLTTSPWRESRWGSSKNGG